MMQNRKKLAMSLLKKRTADGREEASKERNEGAGRIRQEFSFTAAELDERALAYEKIIAQINDELKRASRSAGEPSDRPD